jgi:hypothetical protein
MSRVVRMRVGPSCACNLPPPPPTEPTHAPCDRMSSTQCITASPSNPTTRALSSTNTSGYSAPTASAHGARKRNAFPSMVPRTHAESRRRSRKATPPPTTAAKASDSTNSGHLASAPVASCAARPTATARVTMHTPNSVCCQAHWPRPDARGGVGGGGGGRKDAYACDPPHARGRHRARNPDSCRTPQMLTE